MAEYKVSWEIEIYADSPEEAARKALEIQRDTASIATLFKVVEPQCGGVSFVDLIDREEH